MEHLLELDHYPLDRLDGPTGQALVARCRGELEARGMVNLDGFVRPQALARCVAEVLPVFDRAAFLHKRRHNIYFDDGLGEPAGHPALNRVETVNRTICADQIPDSLLCHIYAWPPLVDFLAACLGKPQLYLMTDPLARLNVMAYRAGEALNWHFDRAEFTITLLLQMPEAGGAFQYRSALRSEDDPNYDGVARLLAGADDAVETLPLAAGTLTVFKGKYTAHRVTPPVGAPAAGCRLFLLRAARRRVQCRGTAGVLWPRGAKLLNRFSLRFRTPAVLVSRAKPITNLGRTLCRTASIFFINDLSKAASAAEIFSKARPRSD